MIGKLTILVGAVALLALAGCIPSSLNGIYTDDNLVFEPALVGVWGDPENPTSKEFNEFIKTGEKEYQLVSVNAEGEKCRFDIHMAKIGEALFLDFYPEGDDINIPDCYELNVIGTHTFFKVDQFEPMLKLSAINYDWLKEYLKKNPDVLSHQIIKNNYVLTGSTEEIIAFLAKHLSTEGAFEEAGEMVRIE
ncbi:MAG: hypothetical protein KOO62_10980 [candidate division Zixibacteria bacterium]|nr:hypothetical protein [candidate division Zixibacteria bacterium]